MNERDYKGKFKKLFDMSEEEFRARYVSGVDPVTPPTDNSSDFFSRINPNLNNHVFDRRGIMDSIERLEDQDTYEGVASRPNPELPEYEGVDKEKIKGIMEGLGETIPSQNRPLFIHTGSQGEKKFDSALKDLWERELREVEKTQEANSELEELEEIYKKTKNTIKVNKSSEKHKNIKWK